MNVRKLIPIPEATKATKAQLKEIFKSGSTSAKFITSKTKLVSIDKSSKYKNVMPSGYYPLESEG